MSDEALLAMAGAVGAMAGNIAMIVKAISTARAATRAVKLNTEAANASHKATTDLADKTEETHRMLVEVLEQFHQEFLRDRDKAVGTVWEKRERVQLARHEELTALLNHMLIRGAGGQPPPLAPPVPEAHSTMPMPDLQGGPGPSVDEK